MSKRKMLKCLWCPRSYQNIGSWTVHVKRELGAYKSNMCPICRTLFSTKPKMRLHLLSRVCVSRSINQYTCPLCDESFSTKTQINIHIVSGCPFKEECSYCIRRFATLKQKRSHEMRNCIPSIYKMITDEEQPLFSPDQAEFLDAQPLLLW